MCQTSPSLGGRARRSGMARCARPFQGRASSTVQPRSRSELSFTVPSTRTASITLWWAGQSLMDLAPYIADARALRLPLLGGGTGAEVEGHDWEYLLGALGLLSRDLALGRLSFALGALAMLGALLWGGLVLWRARRG